MKIIYLLSDNTVIITGQIITSFTTLGGIVLLAIINARSKRVERKQDEGLVKQDKSLEQMDGHVTALVKTTAELGEAIGVKKGKEEEKAKMVPIIQEKVEAAKNKGIIEGIEQQKVEQDKQANGHKNGAENSNQ